MFWISQTETTDATLTAASETELRRRVAEGDQAAFAELIRRKASDQVCEEVA